MINLAAVLPLKSKLENFSISMLLMEVSKYWKSDEFLKISINMKNFNTLYKAQTASRLEEIIQPLTR